jgi:DNA-binding response OmpR family regulator
VSGYFDKASVHGHVPSDALLHKPFTPDTLLSRVRRAIDAGEQPP